jgi:hypothetical protein
MTRRALLTLFEVLAVLCGRQSGGSFDDNASTSAYSAGHAEPSVQD